MKFEAIKKISMSCPACHTGGIILNIPPQDGTGTPDILTASESFACPVCKEKFGGASKLLKTISTYNEAAAILDNYQALFDVHLG
jgi:hypothetical protein